MLTVMPGALTAIWSCAAIALAAWLVGGLVLRLAGGRGLSPAERVLLSLALGLGLVGYAILGLGLAGGLSRTSLGALLLVAALLGLPALPRTLNDLACLLRRLFSRLKSSPRRVLYWLMVVWFLTLLPSALLPPAGLDWDGLSQHLAMSRIWLEQGRIMPLWYDHHSQFPATVQMLYLPAQALGGPVAAKLVHLLYGLLALAALGLVARRHFAPAAAPLAVAVVATTPLIGWLMTVAYVDLAAILYLTLGLHYFLSWAQSRALRPALWAGACLGLALGVKMQSLVFWGALVLAGLFLLLRLRGAERPAAARQWLALIALACAVGGPWYLKSWLWTGNPLYPFAYSVFGGEQWSAAQARAYAYEQKAWGWGELPPPEEFWSRSPLERLLTGPRRPDRLLLFPFGLTFLPQYYVDRGYDPLAALLYTSVGPLYLALLPLLLLWRRPPAWTLLWWALVPLLLWWLVSAHYSRYLLPAVVWLAAPAGWAAARALTRGPWLRRVIPVALGFMLAFNLGANLLRATPAFLILGGQATVEDYLRAALPLYPVLEQINRRLGPDDLLISYGEPRLYYLDAPYMWGDPNYHRLLVYDRMTSAEQLLEAYRELGITHVLINLSFFPGEDAANRHVMRLVEAALAQGSLRPAPGPGEQRGYLVLEVLSPPARRGVSPAQGAGSG